MIKFFDSKGLPNPDRVRIALSEKGVLDQINIIQTNLWKGEHMSEEFERINPSLTLPLIVLENGVAISESTAITEYIDHAFEGICLTGKTAEERATIHMMQRRGEQKIVDAIGSYFHHATVGFGPTIELYQNKAWGEIHYQKTLDGMRYFNEALSESLYIAGQHYSMADITVFTGLNFAEHIAKVTIPEDCNHLLSWHERIAERPACSGLQKPIEQLKYQSEYT